MDRWPRLAERHSGNAHELEGCASANDPKNPSFDIGRAVEGRGGTLKEGAPGTVCTRAPALARARERARGARAVGEP